MRTWFISRSRANTGFLESIQVQPHSHQRRMDVPVASPIEENDLDRRKDAAQEAVTDADAESEEAAWSLKEREERRRRRPPFEAEVSDSDWERGRDCASAAALIFWIIVASEEEEGVGERRGEKVLKALVLKDGIDLITDLDKALTNLLSYPPLATLTSSECKSLLEDKLSDVVAAAGGFIPLEDRFNMLRQLDWNSLSHHQPHLESAAMVSY
ncbi:hypothetical protein SAY87_000257 [Trapa incisa]|uniref:Uncharacterized protein n=1 Tax=Trapa incisa TaxID=236973 RepID=A0AAN7GBS7_9MYRT|nr:hypothetical protein SAY87_000257 [Trapa incisa]